VDQYRENILQFDFAALRRQYNFGIGHFAIGSIRVLWLTFGGLWLEVVGSTEVS
jgi:hypothetical protein